MVEYSITYKYHNSHELLSYTRQIQLLTKITGVNLLWLQETSTSLDHGPQWLEQAFGLPPLSKLLCCFLSSLVESIFPPTFFFFLILNWIWARKQEILSDEAKRELYISLTKCWDKFTFSSSFLSLSLQQSHDESVGPTLLNNEQESICIYRYMFRDLGGAREWKNDDDREGKKCNCTTNERSSVQKNKE